jgi:hypothetical protein
VYVPLEQKYAVHKKASAVQSIPTTESSKPPLVATYRSSAAERVNDITRQLESLGITPKTRELPSGTSAGGVAMRIHLREVANSPDMLASCLQSIRDALEAGVSLNVSLDDLGPGDRSIEGLQRFCNDVRTILQSNELRHGELGLCVAARDITLPAFQVISSAVLGYGHRYVALDTSHMDAGAIDRCAVSDWAALFARCAGAAPLWPVYDAAVRTRCPLLNNEASNALLPGSGIAVPAGTAWLPLEFDISRFANNDGVLQSEALAHGIDACVELGDELFSLLSWSGEGQQKDAMLNRRLAIMLTGIGDLVGLRNADPTDFACLRDLDRLVGRIHTALWEKSKCLAEVFGPLPALEKQHPAGRWQDERHCQDWTVRWQKAMKKAQVRHRNLLVMSPYSVLPRRAPAHRGFIDLLPLIAHADALSFADPPSFHDWCAADFTDFHRRAWAVTQRRDAASFVAAKV